jgi:glycosyltransferase involved in cell wall biosynthesis
MVPDEFCAVVERIYSMKRKVILFGPYPPPYGGVAAHTEALFRHLKPKGVYYWASSSRGKIPQPDIVDVMHPQKLFLRLLREGSGSIILDSSSRMIEYPAPRFTLGWVILKRGLRFHWLHILHDGTFPTRYENFSPSQKKTSHRALRNVDELIAVSEELAHWLQHKLNVKQPVHCVSSLLPLPSDMPSASLPRELNQKLLDCDRLVSSIGQYTADYGFKHVADAVEGVRRTSGQDIKLVLIDGTVATDESYKMDVLRGRSWIIPFEKIPHSQVLLLLQKSDVFVRATQFDGYGLSRIEALWCGTPVIATRTGETRGMSLYDYGDVAALTGLLRTVLFNSAETNLATWADHFRREAQNNLLTWTHLLQIPDA